MKTPWYQKLLTSYISWIFMGFVLVGSLLDSINNAINLISPTITYLGTFFTAIVFVIASIYLRINKIKWVAENGQIVFIKALGVKSFLIAGGILVALWTPRFIIHPQQLVSTSTEQLSSVYTIVDLRPYANAPIDWLTNPPKGNVVFESIPFYILEGKAAIIHTQNLDNNMLTTAIRIPIGIKSLKKAHILLNGNWTQLTEVVGELSISYATGSPQTMDLTPGVNIRETWTYNDDIFGKPPPNNVPGIKWRVVWMEEQQRDFPATGFIDMLSVDLDTTREISSIEVTTSGFNSGIVISGITLERP